MEKQLRITSSIHLPIWADVCPNCRYTGAQWFSFLFLGRLEQPVFGMQSHFIKIPLSISISQIGIVHRASDGFFQSPIHSSPYLVNKYLWQVTEVPDNFRSPCNGRNVNFEIRQSLVGSLPLPLGR